MTAWLAETLAAATILMLLVLALRGAVARAFGAGWAYALWAIPAARLVLPPLGLLRLDMLPSPAGFIPPAGGVTALPPAAAGLGQWVPFMLASWAGGAVIFLILQWLGYHAFLRRLGEDARPARPPFYEGIATFVSRVVEGPVALGLLRRLIIVPTDFSRRYSPAERRLALAHERVHHRHGDLWWNLVAILVLAANWFNPVAWFAFRAFRTDQELACDAAVAARASADERCDYARALVKAATAPGLVAACAMRDTGNLKRRLRMIGRRRPGPLRSAGGLVAMLTLALAGFAVAAGPRSVASPLGLAGAAPAAAATVPAPAARAPAARRLAAAAPDRAERKAPSVRQRTIVAPAPHPALDAAAVPAPVAPQAPAATPPQQQQRVVFRVVHQRFAGLDSLEPATRARVEQAIARARAEGGAGAGIVRLASADAPAARTFILRIRIEDDDQGD